MGSEGPHPTPATSGVALGWGKGAPVGGWASGCRRSPGALGPLHPCVPGSLCERGAGLSTPTGTWSPQNAPASPGSVRCPSGPGSLGEDTPSPVSLAGYSAQLILLNRGRMCVCINLAIITDFECGIQWNSRHSHCPAATTGSRTFSPPHPRTETPPGTERLPFLVPSLCSCPGSGVAPHTGRA